MPSTPEFSADIHEQQLGFLSERIRRANRITVEFGTGSSPLCAVQGSTFDKDNLYIGVNVDAQQHLALARRVEAVQGFAILHELDQNGTLEGLPLPEGIADLVFMGNVFGEPDSPNIMHDFKNSDGVYRGHSSIETKVTTLRTARRLLKPDGRIAILETNTPYRGLQYHERPFLSMIDLLQQAGFVVVDAFDRTSLNWEGYSSLFAEPSQWHHPRSYLMLACPRL